MNESGYNQFKTNAGKLDTVIKTADGCKAVVLVVHGMMEHKERYKGFCEYLISRGYGFAALDLPGHGASIPEDGEPGDWPENGFETCQRAISEIVEKIKRNHNPNVLIFGHSLGSFITLDAISRNGGAYSGCALSGSGDSQAAFLLKTGEIIAGIISSVKGRGHKSKTLDELTFGQYNKRIEAPRTKFDWLSGDENQVDKYIGDPLCGFLCSAGMYREFTRWLSTLYDREKLKKIPGSLPIHLFSGSDDPVGLYGKGIRKLQQRISDISGAKTGLTIYEGMRHEILNEVGKDKVMKDIVDYFDSVEIANI